MIKIRSNGFKLLSFDYALEAIPLPMLPTTENSLSVNPNMYRANLWSYNAKNVRVGLSSRRRFFVAKGTDTCYAAKMSTLTISLAQPQLQWVSVGPNVVYTNP